MLRKLRCNSICLINTWLCDVFVLLEDKCSDFDGFTNLLHLVAASNINLKGNIVQINR